MKVEFYYAHYTRDFRDREVLVEDGTLAIEFRPDCAKRYFETKIVTQMENVFLRVLHRLGINQQPIPSIGDFAAYEFYEISKDIMYNPNRVWQKELGRKGKRRFYQNHHDIPSKNPRTL